MPDMAACTFRFRLPQRKKSARNGSFARGSIGKNCLIAANSQIFDGGGHGLSFEDVDNRINTTGDSCPIVIEDSVRIGANTIILPGVRIGRGSVIATGSVVSRDIPAMVLAGGVLATTIKTAEQIASAKENKGHTVFARSAEKE